MAQVVVGRYALFLIIALGLRTSIQGRRTGASGCQGLSGQAGSIEWFIGAAPAFAILGSALSPVLVLSGALRPLSVRNPIFAAMLVGFLGLLLLSPTVLEVCSWLMLLAALDFRFDLSRNHTCCEFTETA